MIVPQIQLMGHSCCGTETSTHSAYCAEDRRFAGCSSWEDVDIPVGVQRQGYGSDSAENRAVAAGAVHRRGVEPL